MDAVTLALAKGYTDSQRLGYAENKKYTVNSDVMETIDTDLGRFAKVSESPIDVRTVKSITAISMNPPCSVTVSRFLVEDMDGIGMVMDADGAEILYVVSLESYSEELGMTKGTWGLVGHDIGNAADVKTIIETETIHPIDPKYLPGMTEVVDLADYGLDMTDGSTGDVAFFDKLAEIIRAGKIPIVKSHTREVFVTGMDWDANTGKLIGVAGASTTVDTSNFYIHAMNYVVLNYNGMAIVAVYQRTLNS